MNTFYFSLGIGVKRVLERARSGRGEPKMVKMLSYWGGWRSTKKMTKVSTLIGLTIPYIGTFGIGEDGRDKAFVQLLANEKKKSGKGSDHSEEVAAGSEPIEKERKFVAGGNFKMNGTKKELEKILGFLSKAKLDPNVGKIGCQIDLSEVFVSPPAVYMEHTRKFLPKNVKLAAQNCYMKDKGPYTGEVSPGMIKEVGGTWVILGHSERRLIFGESDELIGEKICRALHDGLKVVACIGDTLEEREAGRTEDVLLDQLDNVAAHCCGSWANVIIAYEPVWAIGTGKTATPLEAQEMHCVIRSWIKDNVSKCASDVVRIIYGGSVTKENCLELAKMPDIDGFLVGGASLKEEFVDIINVIKNYNNQVATADKKSAKADQKKNKSAKTDAKKEPKKAEESSTDNQKKEKSSK